jgi:hypothetical protein
VKQLVVVLNAVEGQTFDRSRQVRSALDDEAEGMKAFQLEDLALGCASNRREAKP